MTKADTFQHSYPGQACPEEVTGQPLQHFLHVAGTFDPLLKAWARHQHPLYHLYKCKAFWL